MSLFAAYDSAAQAVHEALFGEAFTLRPKIAQADPNAGFGVDGARAQIAVTGIYREMDAPPTVPESLDPHTDRRPGVSAHRHVVEVDPRTQGAIDISRGDILVRAAPAQNWRVISVDYDTAGRMFCNVERVG
jgi:hypothetical protein